MGSIEKLEMEGGRVINANLLDYCMPTMEDVPAKVNRANDVDTRDVHSRRGG